MKLLNLFYLFLTKMMTRICFISNQRYFLLKKNNMHIKLKPWYAKDLVNDNSWIMHLSEEKLEGLAQGLAHAKTVNKDLLELSKEDFPFSQSFLNKLDAAFKNTQENYGLTLLKGFPVDSWTEEEAKLVYWGMGLHTGVGRTQNIASDIMSDVRDAGNKNYKTKNGRGYNTNLGDPVRYFV